MDLNAPQHDDIAALTKALRRNAVVPGSPTVMPTHVEDDLEASVQVFFVRPN